MESTSPASAFSRRHPAPPARKPTRITVPERVSSHVKLVFTEMQRQCITYDEVEIGSGVNRPTVKAWRHRNRPGLDSIEAVLGLLGWDFVPLPNGRTLPEGLVADLKPVADKFRLEMPEVVRLMAEVAFRDHHFESIRETDTPVPFEFSA